MKGGINAAYVISEMKKEEYYKKKAKRNKCIENGKLRCEECEDREICQGDKYEIYENNE